MAVFTHSELAWGRPTSLKGGVSLQAMKSMRQSWIVGVQIYPCSDLISDVINISQHFIVGETEKDHTHLFQCLLAFEVSSKASIMAVAVQLDSQLVDGTVEVYHVVTDRPLS